MSRPDPDSMALHPAWRQAVTHAWIGTGWNDGDDLATINAAIGQLKRETLILDQVTTDSASYLNEVGASFHVLAEVLMHCRVLVTSWTSRGHTGGPITRG